MGLGNFLWKKAMNNVAGALNRSGYRTQLIDTGSSNPNEKFTLRVQSGDGIVDLYTRDRLWFYDKYDRNGTPVPNFTRHPLENHRARALVYVPANAGPDEVVDALTFSFVLLPVSAR